MDGTDFPVAILGSSVPVDDSLPCSEWSPDSSGSHPIERGDVVNWALLERLWEHSFSAVGAAQSPVLITEPPLQARPVRAKTAEIMFETFRAQSLSMVNSATLSLMASGRTRGVVLEVGAGVSHAVPVF